MKILIADDDLFSRRSLARILNKFGHDPIEAADGGQALDVMRRDDSPKLAILDWMMPVFDGPEVCQQVRAVPTDNPPYLLILTSRVAKVDIVAGLEAGANDYLTKPFDAGELKARIGVGCRLIGLQNELMCSRQTLEHQARHDPLTSLMNRRAILDRLGEELGRLRRYGGKLAVGMIDIDHFKQLNDRYGHQVGDEVLKAFSRRLEHNSRADDAVGRWGGEEFLVITPLHADSNEGIIYKRLNRALSAEPILSSVGELRVTASIGCAKADGFADMDNLLITADARLYRAKAQGRNRVVWAREEETGLVEGRRPHFSAGT